MEKNITCNICGIKYKRINESTHKLTNTHLEKLNKYYCQQCKKTLNLGEKKSHLESTEHKNNKKIWHCDVCGIDMSLKAKSIHLKKTSHIQKANINEEEQPSEQTNIHIEDYINNIVDNIITEAVSEVTKEQPAKDENICNANSPQKEDINRKIKCETCGKEYKYSNEYNHKLTNDHLKALNKYYCSSCKATMDLNEKENHLKSNEH